MSAGFSISHPQMRRGNRLRLIRCTTDKLRDTVRRLLIGTVSGGAPAVPDLVRIGTLDDHIADHPSAAPATALIFPVVA